MSIYLISGRLGFIGKWRNYEHSLYDSENTVDKVQVWNSEKY